jgi:hypothetical protein
MRGTQAIFEVHLRPLTLKGSIEDYSARLAGLTPGFTGSAILRCRTRFLTFVR